MIYDNLTNIDIYNGLSSDLYKGLTYLKQATPNSANGVYELTPRVKVIVSEYETKNENGCGYEAHKKYIDIQYTLKGRERVACLPIDRMTEEKPYSEETDVTFYSASVTPQEIMIGDGYFAIFFPQDGHMPQLCVDNPTMVKKVVVKVQID